MTYIYTCPNKQCKAHYIANSRTKYCLACGSELTNQGERGGGFSRQDLEQHIHAGWCVTVCKLEND